jgi:hypothetical protein
VRRLLAALMVGAAVFGIAYASAAALNVNGGTIQAGSDVTLTCTSSANVDGWGLETSDGLVYTVRVTYDPACAGNDMFIVVTEGGVAVADASKQPLDNSGSTGNLPLTVLGSSTTANPRSAAAITDVHIFIEGPTGT